MMSRARACPKPGLCPGDAMEMLNCNQQPCPVQTLPPPPLPTPPPPPPPGGYIPPTTPPYGGG